MVDRLVGAAVDARVALFVAGETEFADRHGAREGMLVDRAAAARTRVRFRGAGQQRVDVHGGQGAHVSDLSRYSASSACFGVSSSGSMPARSEEHTSELQSLMRISYAVFCLKKKKT